jgi:hypothetical protein
MPPPIYNPRIPDARHRERKMASEDRGGSRLSWARHLISSVGAETTNVARPPSAPAVQIAYQVGGGGDRAGSEEFCRDPVVRRVRVRL